ncbi:MAG: DNA adenine methylase [Muribaculaceae bacterium]
MRKVYRSAPLPFMGQKRRFVRDFMKVVDAMPEGTVFVDLFGGSGLLSHVAKRMRPAARVIYNDYDGYCDRIANVGVTNEILSDIRVLLAPACKDKKVPNELRREILQLIKRRDDEGYVDYVTLSSSLLFSGKYATCYEELAKHTMYNVCKVSDYDCEGYLDGLEVVHCDYRELFARFKDVPGVVFLIDPPYLSTDVGSYKCYWKLVDYLDVLKCLEGTRYVYFTSAKSQVLELCKWMRDNDEIGDPFNGAVVHTQESHINYHGQFTDIMLVK